MIRTNTNGSLKEMRERKRLEEEAVQLAQAEAAAVEKYGAEKVAEWRKQYGAVWFMTFLADGGKIEKLAVFRPIDRQVLSFAASKMEDDGLYGFLEQGMRECWLDGDEEILEDDNYFIPAAQKFNKIIEGKQVAFLKG